MGGRYPLFSTSRIEDRRPFPVTRPVTLRITGFACICNMLAGQQHFRYDDGRAISILTGKHLSDFHFKRQRQNEIGVRDGPQGWTTFQSVRVTALFPHHGMLTATSRVENFNAVAFHWKGEWSRPRCYSLPKFCIRLQFIFLRFVVPYARPAFLLSAVSLVRSYPSLQQGASIHSLAAERCCQSHYGDEANTYGLSA